VSAGRDRLREALERIVELCSGEPAFEPADAELAAIAREALAGGDVDGWL
jgi:hypothetical protein